MDDQHRLFERLFRAHEDAVRAYCGRRLDRASVDDAVAETFAVAWRKIDQLPTESPLLPWLYRVAYHVVQHEWRSNGRRTRLRHRSMSFYERPRDRVVEQVDDHEDHRMVVEAASHLDEADQEILRLTLWEEITPSEAGIVLGISADAAKQRAHRARRRLAVEFHLLAGRPATPPTTTGRTTP